MSEDNYQELYGYADNSKPMAAPAAQTFTAGRDGYLSSVDLYFTAASSGDEQVDSDTQGVIMEIRNVTNQYPGDIVYGKQYVSAQEIQNNVDPNGDVPTDFYFDDPIYLAKGKQYAIVLYTDYTNYQLAMWAYSKPIGNAQNSVNSSVTHVGTNNPNAEVGGQFCYSMNGIDWSNGDPMDDSIPGGTLCLKFSVNARLFNTHTRLEFQTTALSSQNYQQGHTDKTMDDVSYMTFTPSVFTPHNTGVEWHYALDDPNYNDSHNIIPGQTIPIDNSVNIVYIWADLYGTEYVAPIISMGSLHLALQLTKSTGDHTDEEMGVQLDPANNDKDVCDYFYPSLDDTKNAGEYISRTVDFSNTFSSQNNKASNITSFDNVYASYELQDPHQLPADLFVNLNPTGNPTGSFKDTWIQVAGYDEQRGNDWYIVNPFDPGETDPALAKGDSLGDRQYSEQVTGGARSQAWVRYHFHLSLKRLYDFYKVHLADGQSVDRKSGIFNHNSTGLDAPRATSIKWKIIFHTSDEHNHPKLRKFMTTVNNSEDINLSDINANA